MKFLLIQLMHEKIDKRDRTSINFPWGLAYLAACIRRDGISVEILDGQALQLPKEQLAREIRVTDFDVIGISAFSTQFNAVRYLSEHIKSVADVAIVVGGPLATYQPSFVIQKTKADFAVIGEGERTLPELLKQIENPQSVSGIAFRSSDGEAVMTSPQEKLVDLDELPDPDFALFDMPKYLRQDNAFARKKAGSGNSMMLITSRGCPYSCNFCSKSDRRFRSMSPSGIVRMVQKLKAEFDVREIVFGDELFLSSKGRFQDIGPDLKRLGIQWGSQARVNLMNESFLDLVKASGCIGLGYGIESGSQKILENMGKRTTVVQIEKAMKYTMKLKIPVKVQLIFGYPGEDESTVQETIDLFDRIEHPGRRFNVITPLPGSQLYQDCISRGRITDEAAYLVAIEKSFGIGTVHVNFTEWPDSEIYPRKRAAEETMLSNYINKSYRRRVRHCLGKVKRSMVGG
jgi:radical SAM superfamily enzyme YgiQ (UPF0313 family)